MKRKAKTIAVNVFTFVVMFLMITTTNVFAEENYEDDYGGYYSPWYYSILEDGTVELYSCDAAVSQRERVEFPIEVNGRTVTKIGDYVLKWKASGDILVKEVVLPDGLLTIGDNAFSGCDNLEKVNIPSSVKAIERYAFSYCENLKEVTFGKEMSGSIGEFAFRECDSLESVTIPSSLTELGNYAFYFCEGLKEVVFEEGIAVSIGDEAFYGCESLEGVVIPSTIKGIGEYAFGNCDELWDVTIEEGMSGSIGKGAFDNCDSLQSLEIPTSVTELGDVISSGYGCTFIIGETGSAAEKWAEGKEHILFVPKNLEEIPVETITVTPQDRLADVIGSYRHLILEDGSYYFPHVGSEELDRLVGLTIEAKNPGEVEIIVQNSEDPVVRLENSYGVTFKGCIFGHYLPKETEYCAYGADVIQTYNCAKINIVNCDLFGCGFIGINTSKTNDMVVENSIIRDCTKGAIVHYGKAPIVVRNSVLSGNTYVEQYREAGKAVGGTGEVVFENCEFLNNYSKTFGDTDLVTTKNCVFSNNAWDGKTPQAYGICLNGVTWQVDGENVKVGYPITLDDGTVIESTSEKVIDYSQYALPWREYKDLAILSKNEIPWLENDDENSDTNNDTNNDVNNDTNNNVNNDVNNDTNNDTDNGASGGMGDTYVDGNGWKTVDGARYWYENGVKQGTEGRGKEIYDSASDAWYWLDAPDGKMAFSKDVYQESLAGAWGDYIGEDGERYGKWVRYDENGHMVKGWQYAENGTYFFDYTYGTMAKGYATIDGKEYYFNKDTGILEREIGEVPEMGWKNIDGIDYWYEGHVRQGYSVDGSYRGKEIYDSGSDAWYWLDNVDNGKKAVSKDVYQESLAGDWGDYTNADGQKCGKWVRYDENGHMIKGWSTNEDGTYYFDLIYGTMAKGEAVIDGQTYYFDVNTGILQ